MADALKKSETFSNRWGLVFAAVGMAVGTGNIWRFPRVVAANGGAVFIFALLIALVFWAIPLLCMEAYMARKARMGPIGSFKILLGRQHTWMGTFIWIVCMMLSYYYVVVLGWCIRYLLYSVTGVLSMTADTELLWTTFLSDPKQGLLFYCIAIAISASIVNLGIQKGLEIGCKFMIPCIFILLMYLALRAVNLPGGWRGLEFMFSFDPKHINAKVFLEAFTQAAWSTGAGWGLYHTLCVYSGKNEDILLNSCVTAFADTAAAMFAGVAVICTIFATHAEPMKALSSGNNGLAFIHMTNLFRAIPGGRFMAIAFFLALVLAATSTMLSMYETGIRAFLDAGFTRNKALFYVIVGQLLIGTYSAVNNNFFENQDFTWGVALMLSGLLYSIAAMKLGVNFIWDDLIGPISDIKQKWIWGLIRLFPLWFSIIFGWWFLQAASWYPGEWFKFWPVTKYMYTPGVMLFEWAIAIVIAIAFNNKIADSMTHRLDVD